MPEPTQKQWAALGCGFWLLALGITTVTICGLITLICFITGNSSDGQQGLIFTGIGLILCAIGWPMWNSALKQKQ